MQTIRRVLCALLACSALSANAADTTTSNTATTTASTSNNALQSKCEKIKAKHQKRIDEANLLGQLTGNQNLELASELANTGCDKLSVPTPTAGTALTNQATQAQSAVTEKAAEAQNLESEAQTTGNAVKSLFK